MYDYTRAPRYQIENVDHEIHILGVKLGYFPYLLWGLLVGLFLGGPPLAFLSVAVAIAICRSLFKAEERGEPLTFHEDVQRLLDTSLGRTFRRAVPGLGHVERARATYRS
jgi:hypothetical protein